MKLNKKIQELWKKRENEDVSILLKLDSSLDKIKSISSGYEETLDDITNFDYRVNIDPTTINITSLSPCKIPKELVKKGRKKKIYREYDIINPVILENVLDFCREDENESFKQLYLEEITDFHKIPEHKLLNYLKKDFDRTIRYIAGLEDLYPDDILLIFDDLMMSYQKDGYNLLKTFYKNEEVSSIPYSEEKPLDFDTLFKRILESIEIFNQPGIFRAFNSLVFTSEYDRENNGDIQLRKIMDYDINSLPKNIPIRNCFQIYTNDFGETGETISLIRDFSDINDLKLELILDREKFDNLDIGNILSQIRMKNIQENLIPNIQTKRKDSIETDIEYINKITKRYNAKNIEYIPLEISHMRDLKEFVRIKKAEALISSEVELSLEKDGSLTYIIMPQCPPQIIRSFMLNNSWTDELTYARRINFGKSGERELDIEDYERVKSLLSSFNYPVLEFKARAYDNSKATLKYKNGEFNYFGWYENPYHFFNLSSEEIKMLGIKTRDMFELLDNHSDKDLKLSNVTLYDTTKRNWGGIDRLFANFYYAGIPSQNSLQLFGYYKDLLVYALYDFKELEHITEKQPYTKEENINFLTIVPQRAIGTGQVQELMQKIGATVLYKALSLHQ